MHLLGPIGGRSDCIVVAQFPKAFRSMDEAYWSPSDLSAMFRNLVADYSRVVSGTDPLCCSQIMHFDGVWNVKSITNPFRRCLFVSIPSWTHLACFSCSLSHRPSFRCQALA